MIAGFEVAKTAAGGRKGTASLDPVLDSWATQSRPMAFPKVSRSWRSSPQCVTGINLAVPALALTKVGELVEQMDSRSPLSWGQASREGRNEEARATPKSTKPKRHQIMADRRWVATVMETFPSVIPAVCSGDPSCFSCEGPLQVSPHPLKTKPHTRRREAPVKE